MGARLRHVGVWAAAVLVWPTFAAAQEPVRSEALSTLPDWAQVRRPPARRAVVLSIGDYPAPLTLLAPPHDARHLRATLAELDFDLIEPSRRLDRDGILDAVEALAAVTEAGDVAVVYFSGHGVTRNGRDNYLVPLDAEAADRGEEDYVWVKLSAIVDILSERSPGAVYVILDACRTDPFQAAGVGSTPRFEPIIGADETQSTPAGLAEVSMQRMTATSIIFTAAAGHAAYSFRAGDPPEDGSLYTRALRAALADNREANRAFNDASTQVQAWTDDRQNPELRETGAPLFVLRPDAFAESQEEWIWAKAVRQAQGSDEAGQLREYLRRNRLSSFAWTARRRLAELQAAAPVQAIAAAETPTVFNVWSDALRPPSIDALRQPDLAIVARASALFRPRSLWGTGIALPDARVRDLDPGMSVRILNFDAARGLAQVETEDGAVGFIRGVGVQASEIWRSETLAWSGPELESPLNDAAAMAGVAEMARSDGAIVNVRVGLAGLEPSGRAEQISYARALDLKDHLGALGIAPDRILLQIADADVAVDGAVLEVRAGR